MRRRAAASISLLFGLLTGTGEAIAQTPSAPEQVTVDQLVERAVADNPELRAMRAEVDAARGRLRQAALRPNPMLELGGQQNVAGPDSNVSVGLSIPLDLNGRKAGRVGVAEREIEVKQAQVSERERRLAAEVSLKASELLAARRNFDFTGELLGTNQKALGLARDRVRQGAAPALDENLVLVEVNRLEAGLSILKSRVEILGLQLKLLAGMPPNEPLSLQGELGPRPFTPDRTQALERALAGRPDVVIARAEAATAEAQGAERKREATELIIRQEVAAAFTQFDAAQRALEIYTRGVRDVAERNLGVVRQAYELGRIPLLDVIAEQRRYIDIELGYTDVLRLVYDAGIEIQRAVAVGPR